jgi:protein-disulfide isomerase
MPNINRPMVQLALAILTCVLLLAGAVGLSRKPATEAAATAAGLTAEQTAAVQTIVADYIREHPEAINDAIKRLVQKQREAAEEKQKLNVRALTKDLQNDPDSPVMNPDGTVTVVEFFDYECPYCKAMAPKLHDMLDGDKKVRFVFKDFPVLGPISAYAARAALAAKKQGKYVPFHFAMMAVRGQMNEDMVLATAKETGLDLDKLQKDMQAPEIDAIIARNKKLAQGIGIEGTPNFIVGDTVVPGAVDISYIKELVEKAR